MRVFLLFLCFFQTWLSGFTVCVASPCYRVIPNYTCYVRSGPCAPIVPAAGGGWFSVDSRVEEQIFSRNASVLTSSLPFFCNTTVQAWWQMYIEYINVKTERWDYLPYQTVNLWMADSCFVPTPVECPNLDNSPSPPANAPVVFSGWQPFNTSMTVLTVQGKNFNPSVNLNTVAVTLGYPASANANAAPIPSTVISVNPGGTLLTVALDGSYYKFYNQSGVRLRAAVTTPQGTSLFAPITTPATYWTAPTIVTSNEWIIAGDTPDHYGTFTVRGYGFSTTAFTWVRPACSTPSACVAQPFSETQITFRCPCVEPGQLVTFFRFCNTINNFLTNEVMRTCISNPVVSSVLADINECAASNGGCSPTAQCVNTIGSHNCSCNEGFAGNGLQCAAVESSPISSGAVVGIVIGVLVAAVVVVAVIMVLKRRRSKHHQDRLVSATAKELRVLPEKASIDSNGVPFLKQLSSLSPVPMVQITMEDIDWSLSEAGRVASDSILGDNEKKERSSSQGNALNENWNRLYAPASFPNNASPIYNGGQGSPAAASVSKPKSNNQYGVLQAYGARALIYDVAYRVSPDQASASPPAVSSLAGSTSPPTTQPAISAPADTLMSSSIGTYFTQKYSNAPGGVFAALTVIGEGFSAVVFRANWHGAQVAVKVMKDQSNNESNLINFERELKNCATIPAHPRVGQFYGASSVPGQLFAVFALMEMGSIEDALIKDKQYPINPAEARDEAQLQQNIQHVLELAVNASSALMHCHYHNLIHRDVRAANFLIKTETDELTCVITDFGLSRFLPDGQPSGTEHNVAVPLGWMAPEAILNGVYSKATDTFMFGSFLFELIARRPPVEDVAIISRMSRDEISSIRPTIPEHCPREMRQLITKLWSVAPAERPEMRQVNKTLTSILHKLTSGHTPRTVSTDSHAIGRSGGAL